MRYRNSIHIIKLSETSPSKQWWRRWPTAHRNVNFSVFTSLSKRLKENRALYCWDFEKASLKDLDQLMSSSKHPSPSDPVFPGRGGKRRLPHCIYLFPQHLPHPRGVWLWAFYPRFQLSLLRFQERELPVSEIGAGQHWLELPRLYVTVVHSQSIIYTKYKIHFPLLGNWCLL